MALPLGTLSPSVQNARSPSPLGRAKSPNLPQGTENYFPIYEDGGDKLDSPAKRKLATPVASFENSPTKSFTSKILENLSPARWVAPQPSPAASSDVEDGLDSDRHSLPDDSLMAPSLSAEPQREINPDDTCFSTLSVIPAPDMNTISRIANSSPKKTSTASGLGTNTPRSSQSTTPATTKPLRGQLSTAAPLARMPKGGQEDATTQLLDFTEPLRAQPRGGLSPDRGSRYTPSRLRQAPSQIGSPRSPTRASGRGTPRSERLLTHLLDFDMPPAPTPRSIPTITARELESLKAGFLSEISSLRANLSGKEAEIGSLKAAKDDAERRVGDAAEALRDLQGECAGLRDDKEASARREQDMSRILREIKDELLRGEREREDLTVQLQDRDKRLDDAEARASEAAGKLAGLQVTASQRKGAEPCTPGGPHANKAVEVAVDKVARDLHELYKTKHATKVSSLKKSFERRLEERTRDLQERLDALRQEHEDLRLGRDATLTGVLSPGKISAKGSPSTEQAELQRMTAEKREVEQRLTVISQQSSELESELATLRQQHDQLQAELEQSERANRDMVAAVETMLQLDPDSMATASGAVSTSSAVPAPPTNEPARPGLGHRVSGLRGPGFGRSVGNAGSSNGVEGVGGSTESQMATFKRSTSGSFGRPSRTSSMDRMGK